MNKEIEKQLIIIEEMAEAVKEQGNHLKKIVFVLKRNIEKEEDVTEYLHALKNFIKWISKDSKELEKESIILINLILNK